MFSHQAAEQTDGVTFLPEYATRAAVAAGRLAPLKVDLEPLDLWHQLVYHKNKIVTPQMELFAHLVQGRLGA